MAGLKKSNSNKKIPTLTYQKCIAKSTPEGLPGVNVKKHCEYVGEIAKGLMARLPQASTQLIPKGAGALASLHDLGKISPGFQKKINPASPRLKAISIAGYESNHAEISEASLKSWMQKTLPTDSNLEQWAIALGNHHGSRKLPLPDQAGKYGGIAWQQERHKLIEFLINELGKLPESPPNSKDQLNIVSGLTCISDWISSDEDYFPSDGLPTETELAKYAQKVLEACGWKYPEMKEDLSFEDIFNNFSPYPSQKAFIEAVTGPGLYVLEASMGTGKTEAALYATYKLISSGQSCGFYFGLPTRLTSNKMALLPFSTVQVEG